MPRLHWSRSAKGSSNALPGSVPGPSSKPDIQNQVLASVVNEGAQTPGQPRDLWKEAFDSLSQPKRNLLQTSNNDDSKGNLPSKVNVVENVIEVTQSRYEEYCKHGWHTRRGDKTRETNVRILAKETLCSALVFKEIVDQGLKFDPSGYGTMVWGVVSGVLTLIQNDRDRAEAVFGASAVMAKILPKYAVVEAHYRDRLTQEHRAFENRVQDVYVAILEYAAEVRKELNTSVAG